MKAISLTNLKQYLKQRSQQELINQISDLFTRFESVKDYYSVKVNPGSQDEILKKYKAVIKKEFFPSRGFGKIRLSVVKKAISDYRKVATSKDGLIDIMLFYVEMGTEFISTYGDIKEPFYASMEDIYAQALRHISERGLQDQFKDRCRKAVIDADGIGYGFHDNLGYLYRKYMEQ